MATDNTLMLDHNTADPQEPHLLLLDGDVVGRIRDENKAKTIVLAYNAYLPLVLAAKAQKAVEDMPARQGEQVLEECGWDGEQDITAFAKQLRQEALAAAAQL